MSKKSWKKPKKRQKSWKNPKFSGFFKIPLEKTQKTHFKKPGFFQVGFFKWPTLSISDIYLFFIHYPRGKGNFYIKRVDGGRRKFERVAQPSQAKQSPRSSLEKK